MSIAAQCSDCCTCPQPTVEWDSRSANKSKCGDPEWTTPSTPPKIYRSHVVNGTITNRDGRTNTFTDATDTLGFDCATITSSGSITDTAGTVCNYDGSGAGWNPHFPFTGTCGGVTRTVYEQSTLRTCPGTEDTAAWLYITAQTSAVRTWKVCNDTGSATETLADEYTTPELKTNTVAALPAYDDDWNDTAGSFANISTDELSYAIRESRYRLRFKIPLVNTGKNYRALWVERFIAEAGVAITSVEVYSPGVYRPTVAISAPPVGGTQAYAVAVMSSTGTVLSIRILNPGAGYTSAPTVTVQAATGGGTSSTGWIATLSTTGGQVASIAGGSAGNYLPTLAFSGGGGAGATAACTMDAQGGIATVTLGAAGSGYTSAPTLAITAKVSGSTAADLLLHLGTETARCAVWDGVTPSGYDPATPSTYPILGDGTNPYFGLAVPASDGTTLTANLRAVCDGSACP